jgi:hypothetical protein
MSTFLRNLLTFLTGSTICVVIGGCGALAGAILIDLAPMIVLAGAGAATHIPPPQVACTSEDSIAVSYRREDWDLQSGAVLHELTAHCSAGYTETERTETTAWTTIHAVCLHPDGTPSDAPPCVPDPMGLEAAEPAGFGEAQLPNATR